MPNLWREEEDWKIQITIFIRVLKMNLDSDDRQREEGKKLCRKEDKFRVIWSCGQRMARGRMLLPPDRNISSWALLCRALDVCGGGGRGGCNLSYSASCVPLVQ
jgi:hypothetical protein